MNSRTEADVHMQRLCIAHSCRQQQCPPLRHPRSPQSTTNTLKGFNGRDVCGKWWRQLLHTAPDLRMYHA
jgi:hypothetical protein